jgi:hypothetical protein
MVSRARSNCVVLVPSLVSLAFRSQFMVILLAHNASKTALRQVNVYGIDLTGLYLPYAYRSLTLF